MNKFKYILTGPTTFVKNIFYRAYYVMYLSRYGLPVNFQAMLLQPTKKTMKKLREVLNDLYKHLDSSAAAIIDVSVEITLCKVFLSFFKKILENL